MNLPEVSRGFLPKAPFLVLVLAVQAEAQQSAVPDAFRGEWASRANHCFLPHEYRLHVTERLFNFGPERNVVVSQRAITSTEWEFGLQSSGSGSTRRFALSADQRQLTDLTDRGNPITRVRCDMARPRIIGLVEIPALHAGVNAGTQDVATAPVTLHAGPDEDSAKVATILHRNQLVSREHDYEQVSAAVYSRASDSGSGTWFRLGYAVGDSTGYGWLSPASSADYHDVRSLVSHGLAYMTDDWDRRLFARPGSGTEVRAVEGLDPKLQPGARILSIWNDRTTGEDWYLLAVVRGQCSGEPLEVVATGWVQAYAPNGSNTVWYYSRGC